MSKVLVMSGESTPEVRRPRSVGERSGWSIICTIVGVGDTENSPTGDRLGTVRVLRTCPVWCETGPSTLRKTVISFSTTNADRETLGPSQLTIKFIISPTSSCVGTPDSASTISLKRCLTISS